LTRAAEYGEWLLRNTAPPAAAPSIDSAAVAATVRAAHARMPSTGGWLATEEVQSLLAACHVAVPDWRVASSPATAVEAAEQLGFPVVLKALVPDVIHKKAARALKLDIRDARELATACEEFASRFSRLDGLLVQAFRPGDQELFVGVKWDASFGHVIGLGRGGSDVERDAHIAFRLLPLVQRDAADLVRQALPSLASSPVGLAIEQLLLRVAALVATSPEIQELDFNPVAVTSAGASLTVLDARVYVRAAAEA